VATIGATEAATVVVVAGTVVVVAIGATGTPTFSVVVVFGAIVLVVDEEVVGLAVVVIGATVVDVVEVEEVVVVPSEALPPSPGVVTEFWTPSDWGAPPFRLQITDALLLVKVVDVFPTPAGMLPSNWS
jgi:hypothetical protein